MLIFKADLHCHSHCSDGSAAAEDIVLLALEKGLKGLSITDHDTLSSYPKILPFAKARGLAMVPGLELSCCYGKRGVHLLAYAFDMQDEGLLALCLQQQQKREMRLKTILKRLAKLGMDVGDVVLSQMQEGKSSALGRPHIAQALCQKGYVASMSDAFRFYLGEGKPAYAPFEGVSAMQALSIIAQAKGKSIIAHPHLIRDRQLLKGLLSLPFDGLEAYYAQFPLSCNERWIQVAAKKGWLVTGGSDYHGDFKPANPLGCAWTPQETFDYLLAHTALVNR